MKFKGLILILLLAVSVNVFAQLTLDATLSNGYYHKGFLPEYGHIFFKSERDTDGLKIYIFDENYSLIKEIDLSNIANYPELPWFNDIDSHKDLILSQYLFNDDSKIEIILSIENNFVVYNEEKRLIQTLPVGHEGRYAAISLYNLSDDDNNPNYKLKLSSDETTYIYDIIGNPFESRTPTSSSQLKCEAKDFQVVSGRANGIFLVHFSDYMNGRLLVTDIEGKVIKQYKLSGNQKVHQIDLQAESSGIYLISIITKDQKKTTIKVVK
ncbi:MAG: T9SS type A sorting domain-containing protein [Carboxylicivirga sp.]|jgi:hypothetical protein|nr:T9SS type A sorting domain-containing protein [Carboxylicivirga sp.]